MRENGVVEMCPEMAMSPIIGTKTKPRLLGLDNREPRTTPMGIVDTILRSMLDFLSSRCKTES
jgi:hypothetical protein